MEDESNTRYVYREQYRIATFEFWMKCAEYGIVDCSVKYVLELSVDIMITTSFYQMLLYVIKLKTSFNFSNNTNI